LTVARAIFGIIQTGEALPTIHPLAEDPLLRTCCAFSIAVLLPLAGCDGDPADPADPVERDIPGVRETWQAEATPRVLQGSVTIDTLTIEAGTEVCGEAGAILLVPDRLRVTGTPDRPVRFTACDPSQAWGGLRVSPEWGSTGSGHLEHVRIEHANVGIHGWNLEIRHARIRQTRGPGISGQATVAEAVIDTACSSSPSCAAVRSDRYAAMILTGVIIRGSGGAGLARDRRAPVSLTDVTIEGSAGTGLSLGGHILHNDVANFTVAGELRITGNLYPASVALHDIPALLPSLAAHDLLLGNQRDTLVVGITTNALTPTIRAVLPWRVYDGMSAASGWTTLNAVLEPGATLAGWDSGTWGPTRLTMSAGAQIEGTAAQPITFSGLTLRIAGEGTDTTYLRHVRFQEGALLTTQDGPFDSLHSPVVVEDMELDDGRLELGSPGSRIDGLRARRGGSDAMATVTLEGAGTVARNIQVQDGAGVGIALAGDDISLSLCQLAGSHSDGVRVLRGVGITIRECNFQDNAGAGVNNTVDAAVDAMENWWGDPAGPHGPAGDGAAGAVEYEPWLTAPVQLPPPR
jgi:hypothetical protein